MPNVSNFGAQTDNAVVQGTVTDRAMVVPDIPPSGLMSVGPRITPHFVKPSLWSALTTYHFFDAVHDAAGASYVAIKPEVPAGTELTDEGYWFLWADPNSQLADLNELVKTFNGRITQNTADIAALKPVSKTYGTIDEMKGDVSLKVGQVVHTDGFSTVNDGGASAYVIEPTGDNNGFTSFKLANDLFANIAKKNIYNAEELGFSETANCADVYEALEAHFAKMPVIFFGSKTYSFTRDFKITKQVNIHGYSGHSTALGTRFNVTGSITIEKVSGARFSDILFNFVDGKAVFNGVTLTSVDNCEFRSNSTAMELRNLCAYLNFTDCSFATTGTADCVIIGQIVETYLEYIYFHSCNLEGRDSSNSTALHIIDAQHVYLNGCDIAYWHKAIQITPSKLLNNFYFSELSIANCENGIDADSTQTTINIRKLEGSITLKNATADSRALKCIGNSQAYVNINYCNLYIGSDAPTQKNIELEYTTGLLTLNGAWRLKKSTVQTYNIKTSSIVESYRVDFNNETQKDIIISENSPIDYIPSALVQLAPSTSFNYQVFNTYGGQLKITIATTNAYNGHAIVMPIL